MAQTLANGCLITYPADTVSKLWAEPHQLLRKVLSPSADNIPLCYVKLLVVNFAFLLFGAVYCGFIRAF